MQLELAGGVQLAFSDARRFARVRVQDDPATQLPVSALGFDPLLALPSLAEFCMLLAKQKRQVKVVLMDQVGLYMMPHVKVRQAAKSCTHSLHAREVKCWRQPGEPCDHQSTIPSVLAPIHFVDGLVAISSGSIRTKAC